MKCSECKEEINQIDKINLNYDKSSDFDFCGIDCVLLHVSLEIFADDRPIRDLVNIIAKAKRIHEENI